MAETSQKTAVIIGAGPAGLTAAYELLRHTDIRPVIIEAEDLVGGISRTVCHNGNRIDIGGHRFFSKSREVTDWWKRMMPMQGAHSKDDIALQDDSKTMTPGGPDPEQEDRVMLRRRRVSRIYWLRRFFDYPVRMKMATFVNMGLWRTLQAGLGFMWATMRKRPERSLEDFYINRFGRPLYRMFFEDYTTKVWGIHPSRLGADWGSQRVKGLSIGAILKDMLRSKTGRKKSNDKIETSLIEEFIYPKLGPGQLWEQVVKEIEAMGGKILLNTTVTGINVKDGRIVSAVCNDGTVIPCDMLLSTMPIKDLVQSMQGIEVPQEVQEIATALPYRDFITVGLEVKKLKVSNRTKLKTYLNRVPDTWIYIQERDVKIGRLQVFNNWSPYMVRDFENRVWIGLEYFCNEGDEMWSMPDSDFIKMAIEELAKIDILDTEDVTDSCILRVKKAYPAYHGSYYQLSTVRHWLDSIPNLYCIGRNGQHRYNNMDHSMLTAMRAVDAIRTGNPDKSPLWNVNTETDYHESK